ncbi:hypothetical protein OH76DRAFT_193403 [Lentinus brumalis]|uniref:Uncharacterized protein n=1 Tax=Lentinus brumalis TaxID=2498619 RepID=A0A371CMU7_9APHY|nr:hypothetical protein OH76DRAFT_193403 [Polyporus brumalis]
MSAVEYETESDKDGLPVHDERGGLGYTQQASIDRIIDDHPPVPRIDRDVCPEPFGLRPSECPIVYWGFPYKKGYLERYAVRHSLSTREYPALRDVAGPGRQTIQFGEGGMVEGDVPPSAFEALTQDAALADMERKSGLTLSWACPVSRNYLPAHGSSARQPQHSTRPNGAQGSWAGRQGAEGRHE